jgi:hypothetical protein
MFLGGVAEVMSIHCQDKLDDDRRSSKLESCECYRSFVFKRTEKTNVIVSALGQGVYRAKKIAWFDIGDVGRGALGNFFAASSAL